MALTDVSKMITVFQRLCQFAEEFTEEHRETMVAALANVFRSDLPEGQEGPDVLEMINSLLRRLRGTLAGMMQAETELLAAFKANNEFRSLRDRLTSELRELFDRARVECRNHFGRPKADSAGFPARILEDSGALLRQTRLVSWTLRKPDFDLGESLIPDSITTAESILKIYEPKAEELEAALADAVRRRARARGKQVVKDTEMTDFRTTYSLFVSMVRASFRLAGQTELAERMTLARPRRSTTASSSEEEPSEEEPSTEEPSEEGAEPPDRG